jgi:hypothetical protein
MTTALALTDQQKQALAKVDFAATLQNDADEFDRSSIQIPFLRVLQSNSPELDESEAKYIDGARMGEIVNTVSKETFKSVEGVPAYHYATFIEFRTRESGGGFVADHGLAKGNQLLLSTKKNEKGQDILPNGNQLVRTEVYFILTVNEDGSFGQAMMTFQSTQLKKARNWNSRKKLLKTQVPEVGEVADAPFYFNAWKFSTVQESNEKGKWYGLVIEHSRPTLEIGVEAFLSAKQFRDVIAEGIKAGSVNLSGAGDDDQKKEDTPF